MSVEECNASVASSQPTSWYSYAIIRVVPRVDRGEFINAGVILFARTLGFLVAKTELDLDRLRAIAPDTDVQSIARHLESIEAVASGSGHGGPMALLPPSERFHWLTSPRSTVVQTSPIHVGRCVDPSRTLEDLLDSLVRTA
jgi:hypothetical protein